MKWLVYQWGRTVWAFDHDGGVWIQGFAALVTALVTLALCIITARYVRLTKRIASTTERQLSASSQPSLAIRIKDHAIITSQQDVTVVAVAEIENAGPQPVKLRAVTAFIVFRQNEEQRPYPLTSQDNLVLRPNQIREFKLFLNCPERREIRRDEYVISLGVDCCDLAGVSEHSFYFDDVHGLRHFFGFKAEEAFPKDLFRYIKRPKNVIP